MNHHDKTGLTGKRSSYRTFSHGWAFRPLLRRFVGGGRGRVLGLRLRGRLFGFGRRLGGSLGLCCGLLLGLGLLGLSIATRYLSKDLTVLLVRDVSGLLPTYNLCAYFRNRVMAN